MAQEATPDQGSALLTVAAYEIEYYLVERFRNDSVKSRVHKRKLRKLNRILEFPGNELSKLREFYNKEETRGYLYELSNLLDQCLRDRFIFSVIFINLGGGWMSLGKSLDELTRKLDESRRALLEGSVSNDGGPSSLSESDSKVHGFEEELVAVERMVVPGQGSNELVSFKAVGVVGAAGVGKTTLCNELLKRQLVKDHFVLRIYVELEEMDKEREKEKEEIRKEQVLTKILGSLGVEKEAVKKIKDEYRLPGLACAVYAHLLGKRYLIVIDNANCEYTWYEKLNKLLPKSPTWNEHLAYALPKGYGGTVIVTSRSRKVVKHMVEVEENVHILQPLADDKSVWSIFADAIGDRPAYLDRILKDEVKKDTLKKCAGVPLAARMMGAIIKDLPTKNPKRWKELLKVPDATLPEDSQAQDAGKKGSSADPEASQAQDEGQKGSSADPEASQVQDEVEDELKDEIAAVP